MSPWHKIQIIPKSIAPIITECSLWQPAENLWILAADAEAEDLEWWAHTEGGIIGSPYAVQEKALIKVLTDQRNSFYRARFWSSISEHNPGSHKYFLIKWYSVDSEWTEAAETEAMQQAFGWIAEKRWLLDEPVTKLLTFKGN